MNKLHLKKFYFLLIVMLVSVSAVFAQGYNTVTWKFSNPKQFGFTVLDVDYFDNNNVIAVGSDGGIAKSTDAGRNWTYGVFTYINQTGLLVKPTLNDVHFITATTAYAVGNSGVMIKTTDAGTTWNVVTTPLWGNTKNINACWFLDANKGYIGGDVNNTADSLPKLYFTLNGGSTWDSIAAPAVNGVSRVGYINNPLIPSVLAPVDAKLKSIYRIEFINDSTGYVCGSNSYGVSLFPPVSFRATSTTVCTPLATLLTSGSMAASLLWKFKSGVLTDYSLSKERIGYTGINTNTINCTTAFATVTPVTQQYRAMNIINDSTVVLMSFNNNTVVKVNTGINDSTANVNAPGVFEKGKYEVLNFPSPPTQGPNAGPSIPNPQVLLASNPYQMRRTSNGTLAVAGNFGRLFTSVDTGRNWVQSTSLPQGQNFSNDGVWGIDIAPNGRILSMGNNGVTADSLPGGSWFSNYNATPISASYNDMEFTDCNNGIAAGGSSITVTTDGGNTWIDKNNAVLGALFANITSVTYPNPAKVYFTTNIGNIYRSTNQGTTLSPVFGEPLSLVNDLAAIGTDSLWACGALSSAPAASRQGLVFRSFDNGANWDTVRVGPVGSAVFITFKGIEFPTRNIGYIAGNRNAIYKTTDGGATWTDVSPTPPISATMSFSDIQALNKDTVFVIGQAFPNKVVYRTTDGGATWTNITGNITALGVGNLNGILMHDADNGYVMTPGGALLITNDGGATWTLDLAPTGNLFTTAAFVPKTVGPGVSMINRKMFVSGPNVSGAPMMEYGNPASTTVNSTELIAGAACSTPNSGSITITATGGVAPYMYQLGAGPFQLSNVFSGLAAGTYSITIKDAYCGLLTKSVTIGNTDDQVLNVSPANPAVCAGAPVQLVASGNSASYSWSPTTGLSNPNIANPIATVNTTTTYTVTGTLNSCVKTATVTITISPNSPIVILADPGNTLCEGDPTLLTVYDGAGVAPVNLTQSSSTAITALNSVSCNAGGLHTDNSYWRAYNLAPLGLPSALTVTNVTFGIEQAAGGPQPVTVNLYTQNAGPAFPGGTRTLVGSQAATVPNQALSLFTVNFTTPVVVPSNAVLIVELFTPDGQATGRSFFIGSNAAAQTGASYLSAATCGVATPTDVAAIGFPNMHIILNVGGTTLSTGGIATGTFLWSPAAGLSSTTTNPVAASPMVTTTYTVVRTTVPGGCVASAQITITVNQRPKVLTNPVNRTVCDGLSTTFSVVGSGTGLTYQWQVSPTGVGGPWTNLVNGAPYSNVTTAVLTVNPVTALMSGYAYRCVLSGICAPGIPPLNVSSAALLTVNPLPVVAISPVGPVCGGVAGINGTQLTVASSAPPVPGSVTINSATLNLPVPDGDPAGTSTALTIAGVPANATITNISVKLNMPHTYPHDMIIGLKGPSGQVLSLYKHNTNTTAFPPASIPTAGWFNAVVSKTATTVFSTVPDPFRYGITAPAGPYKADALNGTTSAGYTINDQTGFVSNAANFDALYTTATSMNNIWTLALCDGGAGDVGTLTNWSITIDYTTPGGGGGPVLSYVWSPLAGLYTNATATTAYTGTNLTTVYAAPTTLTTYTVTATDVATGCINTSSVLVNYTPPAPTVTPSSVTMCLGDPAVRLTSSSSSSSTITASSGPISVAIPDGTGAPAISTLNIAGVPAASIIGEVKVTMNINHTWVGDVDVNLKAPNNAILNLVGGLDGGAGGNATDDFTNTAFSSLGGGAISGAAAPRTGTFAAEARVGYGPTGYIQAGPATWSDLAPTAASTNGTWTLAMGDWAGGDQGTLTSWSISVKYITGVPATAAVWSPILGLFNDAAASIPYTGDARDTVWTRPTPSGVYPYQVTIQSLPAVLPLGTAQTNFPANNGQALVTFNVKNNNAFPVTLTNIATAHLAAGSATVIAFFKPSAINGPPGAISVANGWNQFGTGTATVAAANVITPSLSGLSLVIPAGQTYGIAVQSSLNVGYSNIGAGPFTFTAGGVDIIAGANISYGGVAAPGAPTFTPRGFVGSVTLSSPITACTSPARTVVVTVNQPATVATQPVNKTVCTDKVATFSVVAAGTGPFSYQWQVSTNNGNTYTNIANGGVYSGATSATLTITAPPVSMSGYFYRVVINGAAPCAPVTSFQAVLTVNPLPTVVISASPYTSLFPGLRTTLSSTVTPNAAAANGYTWLRNGTVVAGANTATLNVDVDGLGDYSLRVTDVNGCTNTSNTISIKDSVSAKCFIYPNPTSGMFQVRYYSVANNVLPRTLTVFDAKGDRVFTQYYTIGRPYDRMDVDMRAYGKGLYWVEIGDLNGNRLTMCRVVIQ